MQPLTISKQTVIDTLKLSKPFLCIFTFLLKQSENRHVGLLRLLGISLPKRRQAKNLVPVGVRRN